jgi:mono/diheme cytochrome c family protein
VNQARRCVGGTVRAWAGSIADRLSGDSAPASVRQDVHAHRRTHGRRLVLGAGAVAVLALVAYQAIGARQPRGGLPPETAAMDVILPTSGGGVLRSRAWDRIAVGEWDTRTYRMSAASPDLIAVMRALAEGISSAHAVGVARGGVGLPDGYGKIIVEPWQPDLKKVIGRVVWRPPDGPERMLERVAFLHRASTGGGLWPSRAGRAVEHGAALFRATCAGCHGIAGGGIDGVAPALNSRAFFTSRLAEVYYRGTLASYVTDIVSAGRPVGNPRFGAVMPTFGQDHGGTLSADQVRDVVAFVLNWEDAAIGRSTLPWPAPEPVAAVGPGNTPVAVGKVVYRARACLGCHGWPGDGGVTGPDLAGIATNGTDRMPGLTSEQYVRVAILGPSATIAPGCPTGPCPDMMPRTYGDDLAQEELDAVVAYMMTLTATVTAGIEGPSDPVVPGSGLRTAARPTDGPRGADLYRRHCQACHGDRGQGRHGTDLSPILVSVDPWAYARATIAAGVPGTTMPGWREGVGGPLSDADLDAVAAHVVALVGRR